MNTLKIFLVYTLEDTDCEERRNFVNWYLQCVHDGQMDSTLFLFSDDYVNILNTRFPVFPTLIRETPSHYIKVRMWCDLCTNRTFESIFPAPQRKTPYDTIFIISSITSESIPCIPFNTPHSKQFYAFWNAFVIHGVLNS
jgi:hypothetical protein